MTYARPETAAARPVYESDLESKNIFEEPEPMSSAAGNTHGGTSGPELTSVVAGMLDRCEEHLLAHAKGVSIADQFSLDKARAKLASLQAKHADHRSKTIKSVRSDEDAKFADLFLGSFMGSAFSEEMDHLRRTEADKLTEDELSTLAGSIRGIGLGMSAIDRNLFCSSLDRN